MHPTVSTTGGSPDIFYAFLLKGLNLIDFYLAIAELITRIILWDVYRPAIRYGYSNISQIVVSICDDM